MAKICKPIAEYKDLIVQYGLNIEDYKPPKKTMKRFIRIFKSIDDNRIAGMIDYPLHEVLLIAFLAVLAGASGWNDMQYFGNMQKKWLKKFLALENGIPSHDTFRRVFSLVNPEQLEKATVMFLEENMDKIKKSLKIAPGSKTLYCVDGKEQKGTGRKYGTDEEIRNLQTLHIYNASDGICLVSRAIDSKTNEIPVAQDALKLMELKDAVVTFDALHTQKETIKIIADKKGDYVGALKGNHLIFSNEVAEYFTDSKKKEIKDKQVNFFSSIDKAHSNVETRNFYLSTSINWFEDKDQWEKLKSFICYEKIIYNTITKEETTETRYYISSLKDVELCTDAIRGHWSVENQLHWHLDVNLDEDENTTIDKVAFSNLSLIKKLTLSIYKLAQPLLESRSIRQIKKGFMWDTTGNLSLILNTFDNDTLITALANATGRNLD